MKVIIWYKYLNIVYISSVATVCTIENFWGFAVNKRLLEKDNFLKASRKEDFILIKT